MSAGARTSNIYHRLCLVVCLIVCFSIFGWSMVGVDPTCGLFCVALCDGWYKVHVSASSPIPEGLQIAVMPCHSGLLERASLRELWGCENEIKPVGDSPAELSVGHSHRSWYGYSYGYTQQYDSILVRYKKENGEVDWAVVPLPFRPKSDPVQVFIPLPIGE